MADEIFFQTLLMHFSVTKNIPLKPSLTYVKWESSDAAHPVTFTREHLNELKEISRQCPEKLFARKFNPDETLFYLMDNF